MPSHMNLAGRTAVVTGAAGGIGRAIALSLAARGCHLALADIDDAGLAQTRLLTGSTRVEVSLHRLDVGDRAAVAEMPGAVAERHAKVDLLINNAGVAVGGAFEEVSQADFEWLFNINFWGVVRMTRAFLPMLRQSDDACIVMLSSMFGLISPPGQTAYSASKFAVRGFSNALRYELADSTVAVTVVHPGGVATSIAKNARVPKGRSAAEIEQGLARIEKLLRMPPEKAAEIIVQGVEKRKARVLVGDDAKIVSLMERLMPVSYWRLLARLMQ
jgi:short-subunit dehydrogenase